MDQDSGSSDPRLPISKAIVAVLDRHAVPERQRLATLQAAAEMSYQQVRRRMAGESLWNVDEVKRLASHFGEPLFKLLASLVDDMGQRATLQLGGISLPCMVWLGGLTKPNSRSGPLVAVEGETADHWQVVPVAEAGKRRAHEIQRLIYEAAPARRVAVLDEDESLAASIVHFLCDRGLDAVAYRSSQNLLAAIETSRFDGYILDWMLRDGNIKDLLPAVRAKSPGAPIILLTGRIKGGGAKEDELESALAAYRAQLYEKPARNLSLFTALDLGFEPTSHTG